MTTKEIQQFTDKSLKIWSSPEKVKSLFAPTLNKDEFDFFMGLGIALKANPFTREIWAVKYGNNPASIFCGRDFYRRKAQELPEYDGHYADSVYSNDTFSVEDGKPQHTYKLTDRGDLLGAFCIVHKKDTTQPFFVFVKLGEYDKKQSNWKNMPDTMIKKVAEAQGLRGAFQGTFKGTYDESEQGVIEASCEVEPESFDLPKEVEPEQVNDHAGENVEPVQEQHAPDVSQADNGGLYVCSKCEVAISEKVYKYSLERLGNPLCFKCQKGGKA